MNGIVASVLAAPNEATLPPQLHEQRPLYPLTQRHLPAKRRHERAKPQRPSAKLNRPAPRKSLTAVKSKAGADPAPARYDVDRGPVVQQGHPRLR
jgi:hypothetical protein